MYVADKSIKADVGREKTALLHHGQLHRGVTRVLTRVPTTHHVFPEVGLLEFGDALETGSFQALRVPQRQAGTDVCCLAY